MDKKNNDGITIIIKEYEGKKFTLKVERKNWVKECKDFSPFAPDGSFQSFFT